MIQTTTHDYNYTTEIMSELYDIGEPVWRKFSLMF